MAITCNIQGPGSRAQIPHGMITSGVGADPAASLKRSSCFVFLFVILFFNLESIYFFYQNIAALFVFLIV